MNLMPRLILSIMPFFAVGYLITNSLNTKTKSEISKLVKQLETSGLSSLKYVNSAFINLEHSFVHVDDAMTLFGTNRDGAPRSIKEAKRYMSQAKADFNQLEKFQIDLNQKPFSQLVEIKNLINQSFSPLLNFQLVHWKTEKKKKEALTALEDDVWKFYQAFGVIRLKSQELKDYIKQVNNELFIKIKAQTDTLSGQNLQLLVMIFLVSSVLAYFSLKKNVVQPIQATTQLLEQMSLGRLDLRLEHHRIEEIKRMHNALNLFASQLENKVTHLQQIIDGDLSGEVELVSEHDLLGRAMNDMSQSLSTSHKQLTQEIEEHKRSRRELEETQAHLIQSEKMSSLGQLVAGVAHEINNPVNFLQSNFYAITQSLGEIESLIWEILPEDEEAHEIRDAFQSEFDKIKRYEGNHKVGTKRLGDIVSSLKSFTRHDQADVQHVNIAEILNDTLVILHNKIRQVELELNIESEEKIYCHPSQLGQVFLNLISNAVYAAENAHRAPQQGDQVSTTQPQVVIEVKQDAHCSIFQVSDNGGGIPLEVQSKVFDPFFTTKPIGEGTGLGLSICYRIIESHQGQINFTSDVSGTTFQIRIPNHALIGEFTNPITS